jgi:hypothetical protein
MSMSKTTDDYIDIDLNGTIDAAIKKLTQLKKEYPKGRIDVGTYTEYGETYHYTRLEFSRPKEPVELEYDKWRAKFDALGKLRQAARAFRDEGAEYPREAELAALTEELGAWADTHRSMAMLSIYGGEVIMQDMLRGGYRRDGTWVFKMLGYDDYFTRKVDAYAQGTSPGTAETAQQAQGEAGRPGGR